MAKVEVICKQCGNKFRVPSSDFNRAPEKQPKYCSKECYHQSRYAGKEVPCDYCGKLTWLNPWRLKHSKIHFCSKSCKSKYLNPILFTGKSKAPSPKASESKKWKGGGKSYRGPGWKEIREQAKKDANYTCQECGIKLPSPKLHVHHKIRFEDFGEDYESANRHNNLIVVCVSCHRKLDKAIGNITG